MRSHTSLVVAKIGAERTAPGTPNSQNQNTKEKDHENRIEGKSFCEKERPRRQSRDQRRDDLFMRCRLNGRGNGIRAEDENTRSRGLLLSGPETDAPLLDDAGRPGRVGLAVPMAAQ